MSNRLQAGRVDRRPVRFNQVPGLPSQRDEMAAYMLGIIATFAVIIGMTYAAIGVWRMLF